MTCNVYPRLLQIQGFSNFTLEAENNLSDLEAAEVMQK